MVSGMYLGEIVRCILCELVSQNLLFDGFKSEKLLTPKSFLTAYISAIETDSQDEYLYTNQVIEEFKIPHLTKMDYEIVKLV